MKHLFVVRHGHYDYKTGQLDEVGNAYLKALAQSVIPLIKGNSSHLISSTAPRALESSELLASELGISKDFEREPYLWDAEDSPIEGIAWNRDYNKLMGIINGRRARADNLIIVTHLRTAKDFSTIFLKNEIGKDEKFAKINEATAVYIDLEKKDYTILPEKEVTVRL
jgi:phosphohistidine phosphatase SixA